MLNRIYWFFSLHILVMFIIVVYFTLTMYSILSFFEILRLIDTKFNSKLLIVANNLLYIFLGKLNFFFFYYLNLKAYKINNIPLNDFFYKFINTEGFLIDVFYIINFFILIFLFIYSINKNPEEEFTKLHSYLQKKERFLVTLFFILFFFIWWLE